MKAQTSLGLLVVSLWSACADPTCSDEQVRVGSTCVDMKKDAGSTKKPDSDNAPTDDDEDPSAEQDDDAPPRDASREDDEGDSQPDESDASSNPKDAGTKCTPSSEQCDKVDNDCDGEVDEGDACEDKCKSADCDEHALCKVEDDAPVCTCPKPFVGDGMSCKSCDTIKCGANSKCDADTVSCECDTGFEKKSGSDSCTDIDECKNKSFCKSGQVCTNTSGSATCACPPPSYGENLVQDPSFESQGVSIGAPWQERLDLPSGGSNSVTIVKGHDGAKAVRAEQSSGTYGVGQTVTVKSNTHYRIGAWMRTGATGQIILDTFDAPTNTLIAKSPDFHLGDWSQVFLEFDSGTSTSVWVIAAMNANAGNTFMEVDSMSLTEVLASDCR